MGTREHPILNPGKLPLYRREIPTLSAPGNNARQVRHALEIKVARAHGGITPESGPILAYLSDG